MSDVPSKPRHGLAIIVSKQGVCVATEMTESKMMQALDWAYSKALNGLPGVDSASEMAENYGKGGGSRFDQANSLIRWQNTKAGTSGFLSGLGGVLTMPVTIPANIASVMYVQIRMIAAIAHLGGHDLRDDRVKTLVYACLTGNAVKDVLKDVGIVVGRKLTESAIKNISGKTLTAINRKVGFRLLAKTGEKSVISLGKAVPIIGGLVGLTLDSVTTNAIGNVARDTFIVDLDTTPLAAKTATKPSNMGGAIVVALKPAAKKTTAKKATANKAAAKNEVAKKATPKRATTKKVAAKKVTTKKAGAAKKAAKKRPAAKPSTTAMPSRPARVI